MSVKAPFQLLEINIISAQDLHPVSKNMRTYATAWVHPNRKLTTRVDKEGSNNPTWNDKFVFRVDDEFLRGDTSAVMIEIYSVHWFKDSHVGTVRCLVGNLIPPPPRPNARHHHNSHVGMRFFALHVRRPSGRPQGILNIGVAVLDSSMRSMPLYTQLSASAVGYRDLMGEENLTNNQSNDNQSNNTSSNPPVVKPVLRRSRSERSDRVISSDISSTTSGSSLRTPKKKGTPKKGGSNISGSGSSDSGAPSKGKSKKGKASSLISGGSSRSSQKGKKGKASSLLSASELKNQVIEMVKNDEKRGGFINNDPKSKDPSKDKVGNEKPGSELSGSIVNKPVAGKHMRSPRREMLPPPPPPAALTGKPGSKLNGFEMKNGKFVFGGPGKPNSLLSDSEVGPSPSEVAALKAMERYTFNENQSSVLDGWSLDESVEGLRSKLERWRTEFPPLYDRGFSASFRSTSQHFRRQSEGGSGLFSCFGNIYGYECQCICGKPQDGKKSLSSGRFQSPSHSENRSF
ncbi:uncharacterized protein LOC132300035 [Cornus florida]|uniref:uncharacterized protein LOC132300035 n=1 Tax=Cornus florida TaxID=4283 RepID=UPI0028968B22|nr:uncharacterized protein LOC132300035 [Cornus florida]